MWYMHEGMGWWTVFGGFWMIAFWGGLIALIVWGVSKLAGRSETAIVSNAWWVPQELYSALREKPVFYARNTLELTRLRWRLRSAGFERFLLVMRTADRPEYVEAQVVDDGGLNFFSLAFVEVKTE